MLSEEEKKVINSLEKEYKKLEEEGNILFPLYKQQAKTFLNIINRLEKENDILKNHVHYIKCQKCGIEVRTKRSDRKYCKKCAELLNKKNNKDWYENLTEEQRMKKREQSKLSMRKLRERRINDSRRSN